MLQQSNTDDPAGGIMNPNNDVGTRLSPTGQLGHLCYSIHDVIVFAHPHPKYSKDLCPYQVVRYPTFSPMIRQTSVLLIVAGDVK